MRARGQYVGRDALAKRAELQAPGDTPAVIATFRFVPLAGEKEEVTCWALVDSGAQGIVVPGYFVGISSIDEDGVVEASADSVAARSAIQPYRMLGVGGEYQGVSLQAEIELDGHPVDGPVPVGVSTKLYYPIVGRRVLNRFITQLNPSAGNVVLGDSIRARGLAWAFRWFS